jgi:hypothetical protein
MANRSFTPVPKPKRKKQRPRFSHRRDQKFLAFVRRLPCLIACRPPHVCRRYEGRQAVEPAHIKTRGSGGDDLGNVVPLCPRAHDEQEGRTAAFERRYGVNLREAAQQIADLYRLATA